jgi:Protein of unknown function (DUF2971)
MALDAKDIQKLSKIFFSNFEKRKKKLLRKKLNPPSKPNRLAHYTTAQNAINIFKSKKLWLRNTRFMDDYSEVRHGQELLSSYLRNDNWANRDKLQTVLKKCGVELEHLSNFEKFWEHVGKDTYICCFSEHTTKDDEHGRLSMWRAFSKDLAAVAIIFKYPPDSAAKSLPVILSPVLYEQKEFIAELDKLLSNIDNNIDYLSEKLKPEEVADWVYWTLVMAVVSLKHPSFSEEREWRLLHLPAYFTDKLESQTETNRGIPQVIYKFNFQNDLEKGISGTELNELVDSVIIGPSQFADAIHESLIAEMTSAGIEDAAHKVFFSNIPLR